jgi:hypothetical protein
VPKVVIVANTDPLGHHTDNEPLEVNKSAWQ